MKRNKIVILSTVVFFLACERDTKLTVEGGNPPKFRMTGCGRLDTLQVGGPQKQREGVAEEPYLYWVIQVKEMGSDRQIERMGPIIYGEVPSGYVQVHPSPGTAPPPLSEDEGYSVRVVTMNANGAFLKFAIHKGEVIVDPVMRNGKPQPSPSATRD